MKLSPFETELLESVLWQVEGFRSGRVTERVTTRILRATLRRFRPRLIGRSASAVSSERELDHAVPLNVVCHRILTSAVLDRTTLITILSEWLVAVELSSEEHRETLKKCGLTDCMPANWDGVDSLARYRAAGISLLDVRATED